MNDADKKQYLIESFQKFGYSLSEKQVVQFLTYEKLLAEWNQKINLTAITDYEDVVWKHFIDSVSICQSSYVSRETWGGKLIDVGTGAGFPGIPLKILFPHLSITLLDALQKRLNFLKEVVNACGLQNVELVHGRAEDVAHNERYRERYDLCVSRAVANMAVLCEYCLPFIRRGGHFIAYKAGDAIPEIRAGEKSAAIFGGEIKSIESFTIHGSDLARVLVDIRKVRNTPKKYPRKAGVPSKKPIQ